jgi:hypothetical protein
LVDKFEATEVWRRIAEAHREEFEEGVTPEEFDRFLMGMHKVEPGSNIRGGEDFC